jgi:hypothetical protein
VRIDPDSALQLSRRMHKEAFVSLDVRNSVAIFATFCVGLLAGIMVGTGLAAFTARGLSEAPWVMQFQLEDRLFGHTGRA